MHALRRARRTIATMALVWFALYVAAAAVSPMMPGPHVDFLARPSHHMPGHDVHAHSSVHAPTEHEAPSPDSIEAMVPGHELVDCSAGTLATSDGVPVDEHGALHCPLCLAVGAPASVFLLLLDSEQPLARISKGIPAARIAGLTGAPLPARGPPDRS